MRHHNDTIDGTGRPALPELHDGHAPIALQVAFEDALYAVDDWDAAHDAAHREPRVPFERASYPVSEIFDHMLDCTDILPARLVDQVDENLTRPRAARGSLDRITYRTAARIMRIVVRRKRQGRVVPNLMVPEPPAKRAAC
jgi:hypothetical protein